MCPSRLLQMQFGKVMDHNVAHDSCTMDLVGLFAVRFQSLHLERSWWMWCVVFVAMSRQLNATELDKFCMAGRPSSACTTIGG